MKKISIKDIAEKAGVSIGTVDRVLHKRGEVKQATKDRILKIVKEYGYTPNIFAKTLSAKKKVKIAIVLPTPSTENPYWDKPQKGVLKSKHVLSSYNIDVLSEQFDASNESSFREALERVYKAEPHGIVLDPLFKKAALEFIELFESKNISYVFIDVNIKGVNNLAYYGQDAEQSGSVAARLINSHLSLNDNALIVKISKDKVFSQHIELREKGFTKYITSNNKGKTKIFVLESGIQDFDKLNELLIANINKNNIKVIYVPNTRVFVVAELLLKNNLESIKLIGYDLIEQNIEHLKQGTIDYLLSQSPEEQAYKAIMALFDKLIIGAEIKKTNYSPIDIIIKENIDYYN